jgi:hypothetical protein
MSTVALAARKRGGILEAGGDAMPEPNIHLSDAALAFASEKAREEGLDGPDQFVEALVARAIRREERRHRLEALLIEGLESGPGQPVTEDTWIEMRRRLRDRLGARKGS